MNQDRQLRWAVLGTGVIANEMAAALRSMGRTLDAVGNRTYGKAVAFAEKPVISILKPTTSLPDLTKTAQGIYSN